MQTDEVKKEFYSAGGNGFIAKNLIYKSEKFLLWKQEVLFELQEIYDRTRDKFIGSVLVILNQGFNGWNDEESYNKLSGSLITIKKNINKYFPNEKNIDNKPEGENGMNTKKPKIFISHSSKDKDIVTKIVDLFEDLGLRKENLFCSSVPGYDIPLGEDIYEYLKTQFHEFNLHVIFVLSQNYYDSTPCLNEMGAAWVLQSKNTMILTPGFAYKEIKGAVNPRQISINLDADREELRSKLGALKDLLIEEFGLGEIADIRWEKKREYFIAEMNEANESSQNNNKIILSEKAQITLKEMSLDSNGELMVLNTISGTFFETNNINLNSSVERREIVEWEDSIHELLDKELITPKGNKGEIFAITKNGYKVTDKL